MKHWARLLLHHWSLIGMGNGRGLKFFVVKSLNFSRISPLSPPKNTTPSSPKNSCGNCSHWKPLGTTYNGSPCGSTSPRCYPENFQGSEQISQSTYLTAMMISNGQKWEL